MSYELSQSDSIEMLKITSDPADQIYHRTIRTVITTKRRGYWCHIHQTCWANCPGLCEICWNEIPTPTLSKRLYYTAAPSWLTVCSEQKVWIFPGSVKGYHLELFGFSFDWVPTAPRSITFTHIGTSYIQQVLKKFIYPELQPLADLLRAVTAMSASLPARLARQASISSTRYAPNSSNTLKCNF